MMAGYFAGTQTLRKIKKLSYRIAISIGGAVICFGTATAYELMIHMIAADTWQIIVTAFLFFAFFFAFAFLAAIIGLNLAISEKAKQQLLSILGMGGS